MSDVDLPSDQLSQRRGREKNYKTRSAAFIYSSILTLSHWHSSLPPHLTGTFAMTEGGYPLF